MKKLIFVALAFGIVFTSCKKKGCTDSTATNYDSSAKKDDGSCVYPDPVPVVNTLCDGITGNSKYLPLAIGYKWTYKSNLSTSSLPYTEEIIGDTVIGSFTYFVVEVYSAINQNTWIKFYREDTNGDIYDRDTGGLETLIIPGTPVVSQVVSGTRTVTSISASFTTTGCSYTGCLKMTEGSFFPTEYHYKPGVGLINSTDYELESINF